MQDRYSILYLYTVLYDVIYIDYEDKAAFLTNPSKKQRFGQHLTFTCKAITKHAINFTA